MACYCCVLGCKNNNHKPTVKHFFRFPKNDEKRSKLWQRFARKNVKATAVICEDHFEQRFMVQKDKKLKLSPDAVPTICFKPTEGGVEQVTIEFNGDDYLGEEAKAMNADNESKQDEEIIAIETAFVHEQLKLDILKLRCRFCAEAKELIEIAKFASYNIDIERLLRSFGLISIESDFFPNSVCEECFHQVLLIDTFIVKACATDQWLWDEIGKLKTITPVVTLKSFQSVQEDLQEEEIVEIGKDEAVNVDGGVQMQEGEQEGSEDAQMFSISYDLQNVEEPAKPTKQVKRKLTLPECAIIDPAYNKFAIKSYDCEVCLRTFAGLKTYKNHVCDVPEIRCTECGDLFETGFALKSHRRHLHNGNDMKSYCPICKTVITGNQTVFKKHKTKCNRDRVGCIRCDLCEREFKSLHGYTVHQMFHKSQENSEQDMLATDNVKSTKKKTDIICELCGKTYTTIGDCRRHIKLKHTELTELFSCDICNKNYPTKSVMKDHFRNTHVVNEVACTFCGKIFRNKTHLKKHMVYHDDSKKIHKCFICPDTPGFINKVGLMRHQARHANNDKVNYSCDICINYNFYTSFQLKSHLKHVHGIDQ